MKHASSWPGSEDVARSASSLRALARELVTEPAQADDLAQDAWVIALRDPPARSGALGAWLGTVLRRLASNARRASARRAEHERRGVRSEAQESHASVIERLDVQRKLLELVASLREPQRTAIYLRYWEDLAPREIAARLGIPVETVKTRLARGLAELREKMDGEHGGERAAWLGAIAAVVQPRDVALASIHGAATTVTFLGGTVVIKQLCAAIVAITALFVAWKTSDRWLARRSTSNEPGGLVAHVTTEDAARAEEVPWLERVELPADEQASSAAAAEESALGELVVRLRWADGTPAADVVLEASCESDPATREERFRAKTDDAGQASFPELFAGAVVLWVDRGYRFDELVERGTTREVELTLPRGDAVAGRVELSTGEPVGGAQIWLDCRHGRWPVAHPVTVTASDGSFRVRELAAESRLGARADGLTASPLFEIGGLPVGTGGARELVLVLENTGECGSVIGRVFDPTGAPVAGAWVKIGERGGWIRDLPNGLRATEVEPVAIETDETGAFRHPGGLPAGELPVHVIARGWPVWSGSVVVEAGATSELEVRLETPATIVGTVFDAAGNPAPDVDVVASEEINGGWHHDPFPPPETKTDGSGRFRLEWVAPGERMLVASDWQRPEIGKALGRVQCTAGATIAVDLVLDRGVTITGRVTDRAGVALAGWNVYGDPESNAFGQTYPRSGSTDADGSFVLPNLDARFSYDLKVSAPDEFPLPPRARVDRIRAGSSEIVIEVADTEVADGRIRGELRDADGRVPRDVWLLLYLVNGKEGAFVDFDPATGSFDHGPLLPGRYCLRVSRGGQTVTTSEPFDVAQGETRDVGLIGLTEGGYVELELAGVPPADLPGLRISLDREGYSSEHLSFENGRFHSRLLAPGEWALTLGLLGGGWCVRQQAVEIVAGETKFVELEAERSVKVPIVCTFDDPAIDFERLEYEVRDSFGDVVLRSDLGTGVAEGKLRLSGLALPAGEFEIEIWTRSGRRGKDSIVVPGGAACLEEREIVLR